MKLQKNIPCPSCKGTLTTRAMCCQSCDLSIEGDFEENEFSALPGDDLHFLRLFIHCDGRIRDMEAALGVSYPTVKNRLKDLKAKLSLDDQPLPSASLSRSEILNALDRGEISASDALEKLKEQD